MYDKFQMFIESYKSQPHSSSELDLGQALRELQYQDLHSIQFNSVYLPIKGPQGATGKLYIDE